MMASNTVSHRRPPRLLLLIGAFAFVLATLSIVDMYLPRPFDGVRLDPDTPGQMRVLDVVPDSGADQAGIRPGDRIAGIANNVLKSRKHAAQLVAQLESGDQVEYLLGRPGGLERVPVRLGSRRVGGLPYLFACILGFSFFFVGLFVLHRQPRREVARVFFALSVLFLLFLVCRLRPASYSSVDSLVLATGTAALLLLPASFLHFFLIFPRRAPADRGTRALQTLLAPTESRPGLPRRLLLAGIYLLPTLVMGAALASARVTGRNLQLISGAPAANWWVLALYMVLGLWALASTARGLKEERERRGVGWVFFGSLFGLLPFLVLAVAFPALLHTEKFLYLGVLPLGLVPLTFAYAIVRFQLLDIRVILHRSLLYTATTAVVTGVYALGIAFSNTWFSGTTVASSRFFPLLFALAIVLLFEPLRRRIQGPIDRFFFAERGRLQQAIVEMGDALSARTDLEAVVRDLVGRLPQVLGLDFAALYLTRGERLERVAGPRQLPLALPRLPELEGSLRDQGHRLLRMERLRRIYHGLADPSPELVDLVEVLSEAGVEVLGHLVSPRRSYGLVLLSGKAGSMGLEAAELELLQGLLAQATIAVENSLLLEERTAQAELERELEIASSIQGNLLPGEIQLTDGWVVASACHPARVVGGDFFTQLPGPGDRPGALVYGDVSGKSVPGALMMMAAHEVLHSLAMTHPKPEDLLDMANRRLYHLGKKSFVALGYLEADLGGTELRYSLAGQPQPLLRSADGCVRELDLPPHRLPLGAFSRGRYQLLSVALNPGDVVLAYTDGVTDTQNSRGEFFGSDRLKTVVAAAPNHPARLIEAVLETLEDFAQGHEAYDDLTLVALGRRPEVA